MKFLKEHVPAVKNSLANLEHGTSAAHTSHALPPEGRVIIEKWLFFYLFFVFLMAQSSTSFVLKLCGRQVPGLESVQASIL